MARTDNRGDVDPGRRGGIGLRQAQLAGPLPVRRGLGVAEHPLGRPGRRHPGRELLGRAARGLPVPGHLRGQRRIPRRRQRPRRPLVQHRPLPGQQPRGHRLAQQRVPRPVPPARGVLGQQPGRRQFPQPPPNRPGLQPRDRGQHVLAQRPARDRQARQHRLRVPGATARPRRQQLRQPGRQPRRNPQAAPGPGLAGQRGGHQLLGEKRIPLRPRIQVIDHPRRHRAARPAPRPARPPAPATAAPAGSPRSPRRRAPAPASPPRAPPAAPHPPGTWPPPAPAPGARPAPGRSGNPASRCPPSARPPRPAPPPTRTSRPPRPVPPPPRRTTAPGSTPRPGPPGPPRHPGPSPAAAAPPLPARTRGGIQRRCQQPAALQPGQLTQRSPHRQQRQRARQRQALPPHHHHPRRRGPGHRLGHEPGFAHPGVPHHQHQPRIAAQRPQQPGQFTLTANKARRPCHVHSPPARTPPVNPSLWRAVTDRAGGSGQCPGRQLLPVVRRPGHHPGHCRWRAS